MQTTKEHTRRLLQDTAREAFLRKGFKAVSMREISKLSGVGLSNIYNYYPCKDDLLAIVLRPLLEAMTNMLENHNSDKNLSLEVKISSERLLSQLWFSSMLVIASKSGRKTIASKSSLQG